MSTRWKNNTASERSLAADLLTDLLARDPERLAWALEWIEGTAEQEPEYHVLLHQDGSGRCLGVAPLRWVAGADQVLEVLDLYAAADGGEAIRTSLWNTLQQYGRDHQARLICVTLERPGQEPLYEFLCRQGMQAAGEIKDYYKPGHSQSFLIQPFYNRDV